MLVGWGNWSAMDCSEATVKTATITWIITDDPAKACADRGAKTLDRGGACIACVTIDQTASCDLYANTPQEISDEFLGHDVKHAFGCKHGKYF